MTDDDLRDDALGARLEVEPLDDLTRRRLVTNALAEYEPPRRGWARSTRWLAAAAAVLLLLLGGVVLLAAPGGDGDRDTAAPARTPAKSATRAPAPVAAAPPTGASAAAGALSSLPAAGDTASAAAPSAAVKAPIDVGDFGDLDRTANLDRLRRALAPAVPTASADGRGGALVTALAARTCTSSLPAGTITAIATGTLSGHDAIVVRTRLADGSRSIDAVVGNPCSVHPLS